jgi:5,6-dimethylbenzimidazole synthase
MESNAFPEAERRGVYRAIVERRDVRCHFRADPIATDVLVRILQAAHHAPSVGFMQPWDFIIVESLDVRRRVKALFDQANAAAAEVYSGDRQNLYRTLKLEGILESPLNLCITCDRNRGGPHVLGRHTMIDTDQFSVCLAVQNLWLAARAEGVGVGWVSILDPVELAAVLKLPESVLPIAYLCLGYVSEFLPEPELQRLGWRTRLPLSQVVHRDCWGQPVEQSMALDDSSLVVERSDTTGGGCITSSVRAR